MMNNGLLNQTCLSPSINLLQAYTKYHGHKFKLVSHPLFLSEFYEHPFLFIFYLHANEFIANITPFVLKQFDLFLIKFYVFM